VDGTRKAAILLLSLDQALAAEVLGKLPRDQVERTTLAIASADNVTREEQEAILIEFKTAFLSRPLIQPAGPETARELLERTLDQNEIEPIQQRIEDQIQAGPFAFLHHRHPDDIRLLIAAEHPQTVAVIVAQLPSQLTAEVMAGFSAEQQADVLSRLARLGPTDADLLGEIAALLLGRIGRMPIRTGGIDKAADVLRESNRPASQSVLRNLEQNDVRLAETLRESLFTFKDLISLDEPSFQVVLDATADCEWSVALKGSSDPLRQRVLEMLPAGLAQALKTEMNAMGPLRLSEITAVQRRIADAVLSLESAGRIELPSHLPRQRKATG